MLWDVAKVALSVLLGGVLSTTLSLIVTNRRAKRDLALKMVDDFNSHDAHDLRASFWVLVEANSGRTFDQLDGIADAEQRKAFRFVLGFFTQAGTLMREGLLNEPVFFALSERWMREIGDRHLFSMAARDATEHYAVHREALKTLKERWDRRRKV